MGWLRAPVLDEEVRTAPELTCFRLALLPDVAEPDESVRRFEELEPGMGTADLEHASGTGS